jgi:hypothetical protein
LGLLSGQLDYSWGDFGLWLVEKAGELRVLGGMPFGLKLVCAALR